MASGFFKFYFIKNTKYILITMKDIKTYLTESSQDADNKIIFDACMEMDNNETIYKQQYWPLVQNLIKKHQKGIFDIAKLESSSVVSKLCQAILKATKATNRLSKEGRKRLAKFVTGSLVARVGDQETLTKEEEDYMIEWDYANSEKCGW